MSDLPGYVLLGLMGSSVPCLLPIVVSRLLGMVQR